MRRIGFLTVLFAFAVSSGAWALVGTPCDPEKDFKKVFMIRNWKKLPHKNQEETKERVDQFNKEFPQEKWEYKPEPNTPIYSCLSHAASSMADWWAIEMGRKLPTYRSFNNGQIETGFNPRKLEVRYRKNGKWNKIRYLMLSTCPITGWKVPIRPKGYSRILVSDKEETIFDPLTKSEFKYSKNDYPMEGKWKAVVSKHWFGKKNDAKLVKAIRDHGPLYIQFEMPTQKYLMGTHAVVVVGIGELENGQVAYICHDSFGNFPKDHEQDAAGAPAYRYCVADEIDEAIVFPHTPVAKAYPMMGGVTVKIMNQGGQPVTPRRVFCINKAGKAVKMQMIGSNVAFTNDIKIDGAHTMIYVEADYYMKEDGKGHWLKAPLALSK